MSTPGAEIHGAQRRHSAPLRGPRAGRHPNRPHCGPLRSLPPEQGTLRDPLIRSSLTLRRDRAARPPPATRVQLPAIAAVSAARPAWGIVPFARHSVGTTVRSATESRNAEVTLSTKPGQLQIPDTNPTVPSAPLPSRAARQPLQDSDETGPAGPQEPPGPAGPPEPRTLNNSAIRTTRNSSTTSCSTPPPQPCLSQARPMNGPCTTTTRTIAPSRLISRCRHPVEGSAASRDPSILSAAYR